MTFADHVDRQAQEWRRSIEVSDELRGEITAHLRTRRGMTPENGLFYAIAFERLLAVAGDRIARLEAQLAAGAETTTPAAAGRAVGQEALGPRLAVAGEKEAHSHAERGIR